MNQILLKSLLIGVEIEEIHYRKAITTDSITVSRVIADSRKVVADTLFVALVGTTVDAHSFLRSAVAAGAQVLVINTDAVEKSLLDTFVKGGVVVVEVVDTNIAWATIAANFYGNPGRELTLVGVTGTNGKTTVTYLVEHVLCEMGLGVGVIGTVNNRYTTVSGKKKILQTEFTTPEPLALQKCLREMADNEVSHVIMEVSSHALSQGRVASLSFSVAAFTNLSRDHLDYHLDMRSYFDAKSRLFSHNLLSSGIAVLPERNGQRELENTIDALYQPCEQRGIKIISWGENKNADISLKSSKVSLEQTEIVIQSKELLCNVKTTLVGSYNVENLLVAYGICDALGFEQKDVCQYLATTPGAPGRLERIVLGEMWSNAGPTVFVDYAHTPDALEKVLATVKELPHSKLITVCGCGGDRDGGKRPLMGAIATRLSDVTIVTDDNPRTENPDTIVAQILAGVDKQKVSMENISWLEEKILEKPACVVIRDRSQAIEAAIKKGRQGDIVVIAGKGHEPYQLTAKGKKYFDDRQQARRALFSWNPELITRATGGILANAPDGCLLSDTVVTDSREKNEDGIFVALVGENHDAHDYVKQAVNNGNRCLVVKKQIDSIGKDVAQIVVGDTTRAIGDLASYRRQAFGEVTNPIVIGLTGSCGKTTVKEMVAAIFNSRWQPGPDCPENAVLKTKGNFNNLIGLPLSLLPLGVDHRAVVLEMGMNSPGEISKLCDIAKPNISCITNVQPAHLEGLGSIDGVMEAKGELFEKSSPDSILIVNLDDHRVKSLGERYPQKRVTYSTTYTSGSSRPKGQVEAENSNTPDIFATNIHLGADGVTEFILHAGDERQSVKINIPGEHNVSNALCAAAIALAAGTDFGTIVTGLTAFHPADKRMEIVTAKDGYRILNDSYNANPASMAAGLRTLTGMGAKDTVAILGDMLELGEAAEQEHFELGRLAVELKVGRIAVFGSYSGKVVEGAIQAGATDAQIQAFADKEMVINWAKQLVRHKQLGKDDLLLVKASRGLRFETIVEGLLG